MNFRYNTCVYIEINESDKNQPSDFTTPRI